MNGDDLCPNRGCAWRFAIWTMYRTALRRCMCKEVKKVGMVKENPTKLELYLWPLLPIEPWSWDAIENHHKLKPRSKSLHFCICQSEASGCS
jgi:hypothetical protein